MKRRWLVASLVSIFAILSLLACLPFGLAFALPADARSPHPSAQLVDSATHWDLRGLHTVRVYRIPVSIQAALEWYYNEGVVPKFARNNPNLHCASHRFNAPPPRLPFPFFVLSRYSATTFCSQTGYTEVSTDTYYYWRYVEP
jgi:hypothetical protein